VCSIFDSINRYFELMSHFKIIYLVSSIICCGFLIAYKCYRSSIIMFALVIVHLFSILPWYFTTKNTSPVEHKTSLKILHSNVLTSNREFELFSRLLEKENPTVVVLQEVNKAWVEGLANSLTAYKYRIEQPQNDNFGIAIYSKLPFIKSNIISLGDLGLASLEVSFSVEGQDVTLIATHPIPPISNLYHSARNNQLIDSAKRIVKLPGAKILVGDLNVSMWSGDYLAVETISGLNNARQGFGILPTWPTYMPFLMIPIDHILISKHFVINDFKVGDNIGSDHLPLITELALLKQAVNGL